MTTRKQAIERGRVWQVYEDGCRETILHEGTKSSCQRYLRERGLQRYYRRGLVRMAQVIWEDQEGRSDGEH